MHFFRVKANLHFQMMMMMFTPERHLPTSGQHGPAPSGTPLPAQPPPHFKSL